MLGTDCHVRKLCVAQGKHPHFEGVFDGPLAYGDERLRRAALQLFANPALGVGCIQRFGQTYFVAGFHNS
jgi:hypothetical protein